MCVRKDVLHRMHICIYISMYICMLYVCVCIYVCMYVYMYVYMCVCMYIIMYVCMYVCFYVCMYIYVCMYVCLYVPQNRSCYSIISEQYFITILYQNNPSTVHQQSLRTIYSLRIVLYQRVP